MTSSVSTETRSVHSKAREQLLDTAVRLFYGEGCLATGIDRLLAEAGVAKMTLYKHFKSKDDLILAAAERMRATHFARMQDYLDRHGETAADKLLAMFDYIGAWAGEAGFNGCPFMRLAVEHPHRSHPAHCAAARFKREQADYFLKLAREAAVADPEAFVSRYMMLVEGAVALVHISGDRSYVAAARETARLLLREQRPEDRAALP